MKDEMGDIDPQLRPNEDGEEDSHDDRITMKAVTPQEIGSRQDEPLRNIQRNWNSPFTQA
ncbi:hypothetical protein ABVK25_007348 [Lepraria finkii]|uniref:Uncharacterized protein n=1 Tax=Lepraria finkii TaxID=1340010 RepID=A0ABR4B600_9LECA